MQVSSSSMVGACVSAALLAGCGGATTGIYSLTPLSAARSQPALGPYAAHRVTEKVLHNFTGGTGDGAYPVNLILTDLKGVLYGTTEQGGASACQTGSTGCGTVFEVSTSGAESVLYSFKGGKTDGQYAKGGVVERSDVLYGTTQSGGTHGGGTFFKVTTSGNETVLHSFRQRLLRSVRESDLRSGKRHVLRHDALWGQWLLLPWMRNRLQRYPIRQRNSASQLPGGQDGDFPTGSLLYSNGDGTTLLGGSGSCTRTAGQWLWHRLLIVGVLITVVTSWRVGEINSRRTRSRHRRSAAFSLTR